jgi:hypothetical protein
MSKGLVNPVLQGVICLGLNVLEDISEVKVAKMHNLVLEWTDVLQSFA